ncbi:MAG: Hsp70 family protein, partial [Muribaculaceae bacterium]|nr:Hsp70 family protein [Muribaculaceae bacterium]
MGKIFGIDLGTTYSCIAYVNDFGKPEVVPNSEASPVTPSVVAFEEGDNASVGESAKQTLATDPVNVCSVIKRQMGKRDYKFFAFDKEYTPEAISAIILRKIAQDASEQLGEEVKNVVITCPAYFGMEERNATKTAGELAGLNVLDILNEPTAAAISYGLNVDQPQTVLVYDLGGGTFDITMLRVENGKIQMVVTGGNHELGGKDWDNKIIDHVISEYCSASGEDSASVRDDIDMMGELELSSENAKKQLTQKEKTIIKFNGERIELTREKFDEMTKALLDTTMGFTKDILEKAAAKGVKDFDKILLVGGSTMMKQVKERLEAEFPGKPIEYCDPNQSVAKGAAIYGINLAAFSDAMKEDGSGEPLVDAETKAAAETNTIFGAIGGRAGKKIEIENVLSRSVAMRFVSGIKNIVMRNTAVPHHYEFTATTVEANQEEVLIELYEDLSDEVDVPEDACTKLADQELPLNPNLPADSPLDVVVNIDKSGLLSVDVTDASSNVKLTHIEMMLQNALSEVEKAQEKVKVTDIKLI